MDSIQDYILVETKKLAIKIDAFDKDWRYEHLDHSKHAVHHPNNKWYCKHLVSARNRKFRKEVEEILGPVINAA